jgi:hypothetical protein
LSGKQGSQRQPGPVHQGRRRRGARERWGRRTLRGRAGVSGDVRINGTLHCLSSETLILIPKGARLSTRGTSADFAYLTVHQRCCPMKIRVPRRDQEQATRRDVDCTPTPMAGDSTSVLGPQGSVLISNYSSVLPLKYLFFEWSRGDSNPDRRRAKSSPMVHQSSCGYATPHTPVAPSSTQGKTLWTLGRHQ